MTATQLRRELSARALHWAEHHTYETTYGSLPSVVFSTDQDSALHRNFIDASWRRIQARPSWRRRLDKSYTGSRSIAHPHSRRRAELDCASSSDALLMNLFCFPGLLRRPSLAALLGIDPGLTPRFGVRLRLPLLRGLVDRTETDMVLGDLLVEAKLTETDFQDAAPELLARYPGFSEVFDAADLPRTPSGHLRGYQLLRGVLAAHTLGSRFAVLSDARRHDLIEQWFAVLRAVSSADLRSRLQLITWQEIAQLTPPRLKLFLARKYGIGAEQELRADRVYSSDPIR